MSSQRRMPAAGRRADAVAEAGWERYRLIADNASDVVYQTGTDGLIRWISPTVEALLGYEPSSLVGVSARSLVHPDDLPMVDELRLTVYDGDELDEIPCRFLRADGTARHCSVRARPVRDESGAIVGAVMALRDTHERTSILRALTTLSEATRVAVDAPDEATLLRQMCETVVEAGQYALAVYGRKVEDEARTIEQVARAGPETPALDGAVATWGDGPTGQGPTGTAVRTGTTVVINGMADDERIAAWRGRVTAHALVSAIGLPIRVHGTIDGVLSVYSHEPGTFDALAHDLLEDLGRTLGAAIERLRERDELQRLLDESREQRLELRSILDSQLDPLVLLRAVRDDDGTIVDLEYAEANDAALAYNKRTREEQIGQRFLGIHPSLRESGLADRYFGVIETGEPVILDDYTYANPNWQGASRRYDIRAVPAGSDSLVLTWRDVTERYAERVQLARREERYRRLVENTADIVWELDSGFRTSWVSETVERVLGWKPDELIGTDPKDRIHPDDVDRIDRARPQVALGLTVNEEFRMRAVDGAYRWMGGTAYMSGLGGQRRVVITMRDIEDEIRERAQLDFAVRHDVLTGLITRAMLVGRLADDLLTAEGVVAVLKMGIDGLARINDALGHNAGDLLIAAVAGRAFDVVPDGERMARGSGDEMILVLTGLRSGSEAGEWADRIRDAVRQPLDLGGQVVVPTVTIGVATSDRSRTRDAENMLRAASVALRAAKRLGGDRTEYVDPALAEEARHRLSMERELRDALDAGELRAWYQPVVSMASGVLVGHEVLVRWILPDGTVRTPDQFLPTAERSGLVVDLDRAVLEQAVQQLRTLPRSQHLAVNVSAASLSRSEYMGYVADLLRATRVDPSRLVLEITETSLVDDIDVAGSHMQVLADIGVRWFVDDFGTGYSSIAHVRDLPVSGLKLDRSFTQGIGDGDGTCIRLAQALSGLASGLGLDTVAEGVETEEEAAYLLAQGWRHGQGWLYGKPAAAPKPA